MKRSLAFLALSLCACVATWAELEYRGLDLGKDDSLLFSARAELPGDGPYDTLFASDLDGGGTAQLTMYPEQVSLVEGGARLQVQNRFGLFRSDRSLSGLAPVTGYPAFARGSSVRQGRLVPCATSPDGAYVLSIVPTSAAYARLVLFDVAKSSETVVASKVGFPSGVSPARWSPDSRNFAYAKDGSIYYYSVDQLAGSGPGRGLPANRGGPHPERALGLGRLAVLHPVHFAVPVLPAEFFTQALYRGAAGMGVLAGKAPFPFDPNFDDFWVSRDASRIILCKVPLAVSYEDLLKPLKHLAPTVDLLTGGEAPPGVDAR